MALLRQWRTEIANSSVRVLFLDECHLLWGDSCGYTWGKRNQRVKVPIASPKQRQTYFGALDYHTKRFEVHPYDTGNTENTITFLQYLLSLDAQARLVLIWDGVPYHCSKELREFLSQVNGNLLPEQWRIRCIQLAPYAPEQNPVEDIWLEAKRILRQCHRLCTSFVRVKCLFEFVIHRQVFTFIKLFMYDPDSPMHNFCS
ncbi:MAG: transposase [Elainella sp. C42_A2020_010]|nr:transposase [Elainella sp. C42_A2020_010]